MRCEFCGSDEHVGVYKDKSGRDRDMCSSCYDKYIHNRCVVCGRQLDDEAVQGRCLRCAQVLAKSMAEIREEMDLGEDEYTEDIGEIIRNTPTNQTLMGMLKTPGAENEPKRLIKDPLVRKMWEFVKLKTANVNDNMIGKYIGDLDDLLVANFDKLYGVEVHVIIEGTAQYDAEINNREIIARQNKVCIVKGLK